jgi:ribosome-binding protein aMBF1 (putative translation factor)
MTNKEKFLALVSDDVTQTMARNQERIANRAWLYQSQEIAMSILDRLEDLDWTQRVLAEKMGVSPQQVNKIVKGKENLTLETLTKLQTILDIPIFANYVPVLETDDSIAQAVTSFDVAL